MKGQKPPEDLAADEKALWHKSEGEHKESRGLRRQASRIVKDAKVRAKAIIAAAEAEAGELYTKAEELREQGNLTNTAMHGLINKRQDAYVANQRRIIREKKLDHCEKCSATGVYPCTVPGTRIVLQEPHPEREPKQPRQGRLAPIYRS